MRSSDGKPLQCFEVAEYDGIYYLATAEVVGDQVKVYSKEVPNPRYVRYGWQPFTRANLINREGTACFDISCRIFDEMRYFVASIGNI